MDVLHFVRLSGFADDVGCLSGYRCGVDTYTLPFDPCHTPLVHLCSHDTVWILISPSFLLLQISPSTLPPLLVLLCLYHLYSRLCCILEVHAFRLIRMN